MSEFSKKVIVDQVLADYKISFHGHSVVLNGGEYKKAEFGDLIGTDLLEKTDTLSEFYRTHTTEAERKKFWLEVFMDLKREVKRIKKKAFSTDNLPESTAQCFYIPVLNIADNTVHLVNPETRELSEMIYDAWKRTLAKDDRDAVERNMRLARFVYDPYNIEGFSMEPFENYDLLKVNLYRPPAWRKRPPLQDAVCPPRIWRFLNHLFPSKGALTYILDWLYYALVSRNEAYLVLNGAKGVGKGVFCSISEMLVGKDNYTVAPDSFMESHFNATLDKKRIINIDDMSVDKQKHTRLKRYANKFQNIEKKGVDANKAVEIFNSYIINNNDITDMYLEYDDRRFSVVDITDKMLNKVMHEEEITELIREMEDPNSDMAYEFGYFIFNRKAKEYNEFSIFRGEKYNLLVEVSLRAWQKFILHKILEGNNDTLDLTKLKREYRIKDGRLKFPAEVQKVQDFLNNYRYGDKRLGEVVREEGRWFIRVEPWTLKDNLLDDKEVNRASLL